MEHPAAIGENGQAVSGRKKGAKNKKSNAPENTPFAVKGAERETIDTGVNNFAIKVVFRTEPGHTTGTLVAKGKECGDQLTINPAGARSLDLRCGPSRLRWPRRSR